MQHSSHCFCRGGGEKNSEGYSVVPVIMAKAGKRCCWRRPICEVSLTWRVEGWSSIQHAVPLGGMACISTKSALGRESGPYQNAASAAARAPPQSLPWGASCNEHPSPPIAGAPLPSTSSKCRNG
jgi:hypothetical protein